MGAKPSSTSKAGTDAPETGGAKSVYCRYQDAKTGRSKHISDDDLKKCTGMTRSELGDWAKDRPGVACNQAAGKLDMGPATGLGGSATADGYGGWGPDAAGKAKFPPKQKTEDEKQLREGSG